MILLYHRVFPDDTPPDQWTAGYVLRLRDFMKQVCWLKQRFKIVPLQEYLSATIEARQQLAALTFDDGYQTSFAALEPYLLAEHIPATFFLNTHHLDNAGLPWFAYLNALCHEKTIPELVVNKQIYVLGSRKASTQAWSALTHQARSSGDAIAFVENLSQLYPLSEEITTKYLSLSKEQITSIGACPWLEVGGHTHNHPYLDQISPDEQFAEMFENKQILEDITGESVCYFAYPGGVYNEESLQAVMRAGFEAAFAIRPLRVSSDEVYEMPRTDIYSPALWKFKLKVLGLADIVRQLSNVFLVNHD